MISILAPSRIRGLLAVLAVAVLPAQTSAQASTPTDDFRGTVVLVHGAWGGGWDWRPVDRMLTARGFDVYRATLTGLGERVHLIGPEVDLSTHIQDVVNTILFEDLDDVVLVGHSYGGMVITGVADSIPDRLESVIYMDAFLPFDGESVSTARGGGGDAEISREPIVPSWIDPSAPYPRDVPHPGATFGEPIHLRGEPAEGLHAAYILTELPDQRPDGFQWAADRAEELGWPIHVIESDHNAQRSAREELVRLIEEIAVEGSGR